MPLQSLIDLIFTILILLAVIPGLWLARRALPQVIAWIPSEPLQSLVSKGWGRFLLWVALASFFTTPLIDLAGSLRNILYVFLPNVGPITTPWGSTSFGFFALLSVLISLAIYAIVLWPSRRFWNDLEAPDRLLRVFGFLGAAALIDQIVLNFSERILFFPVSNGLPSQTLGTAGFLLGWLVGLVVLAIVVVGIDYLSTSREVEQE